jgi:hypothetical protein
MAKRCGTCGNVLPEYAEFCDQCGSPTGERMSQRERTSTPWAVSQREVWEYKYLPYSKLAPADQFGQMNLAEIETNLSKLGSEGWELAGVVSWVVGQSSAGTGETYTTQHLIFKRRKQ